MDYKFLQVDDIGKGSDFDDLIRLADVCAKELREKHPALVKEFSDVTNAKQQQQQQGDLPVSTETIPTCKFTHVNSISNNHHRHHHHHHDDNDQYPCITEEGVYGRSTGKKKLDGVLENNDSGSNGSSNSGSSSSGSENIVNPDELQREGKNKTAKL